MKYTRSSRFYFAPEQGGEPEGIPDQPAGGQSEGGEEDEGTSSGEGQYVTGVEYF